jgi:hypothetical protein
MGRTAYWHGKREAQCFYNQNLGSEHELPAPAITGEEMAFVWRGGTSLCSTQDTIISPITHNDSQAFILFYLLFKTTNK